MKGLSTILAMILIVIIVVALIGLTYTFAANLFQTTTSTASTSVETTTRNMDKHVSIIGVPSCKNSTAIGASGNYTLIFTVRHDGATYNINEGTKTGELALMLDSMIAPTDLSANTFVVSPLLNTQLNYQTMKTYTVIFNNGTGNTWTGGIIGSHTLRLITPAGEISESITCSST